MGHTWWSHRPQVRSGAKGGDGERSRENSVMRLGKSGGSQPEVSRYYSGKSQEKGKGKVTQYIDHI